MKSLHDIARCLNARVKSSGVVVWKSHLVWGVCSLFNDVAQSCKNARSNSRSLGHAMIRMFRIHWQIWIQKIIIHVLPVTAALTIIVLNVRGFFIGKQLQGSINQDGIKMLLLQITAKIHELLILASLGDILYSCLLNLLVFGEGVPLGALTAGEGFGNISYLWSKDFLATCRATFSEQAKLVCLVVVCTILGIVVGPSSATAMAPWRDTWIVDKVELSINISKQQLWPSTLSEATLPQPLCSNRSRDCGDDTVWASLSANLFSYWGEPSYGGLQGMPEAVGIGGPDVMRFLRVRFRGPISMYQPDFTVATVQPVSAARMVNGLRMIWFSTNAKKCERRRGGYCDYEDIQWSISTMQPTVYVACVPVDSTKPLEFPTLVVVEGSVATSKVSVVTPIFTNISRVAAEAVQLDSNGFPKVSVGSLVRVKGDDQDIIYACSIDAQWSKSAVVTTFLGSPYMVDGNAPDFFIPTAEGSTYEGERVRIEPSWANSVLSSIDPTTNRTVLDDLYAEEGIPDPSKVKERIESMLSVLIAENMARVESEVELYLGDAGVDPTTLQWNQLRDLSIMSTSVRALEFQTIVTGYGYGILNGGNVAVGPLLSVLVLLIYCLIVIVHFGVKLAQWKEVGNTWRSMIDLLLLALQTSLAPAFLALASRDSGYDSAVLRENVRLVCRDKQVSIVFVNQLDKSSRYQRIGQDDEI